MAVNDEKPPPYSEKFVLLDDYSEVHPKVGNLDGTLPALDALEEKSRQEMKRIYKISHVLGAPLNSVTFGLCVATVVLLAVSMLIIGNHTISLMMLVQSLVQLKLASGSNSQRRLFFVLFVNILFIIFVGLGMTSQLPDHLNFQKIAQFVGSNHEGIASSQLTKIYHRFYIFTGSFLTIVCLINVSIVEKLVQYSIYRSNITAKLKLGEENLNPLRKKMNSPLRRMENFFQLHNQAELMFHLEHR